MRVVGRRIFQLKDETPANVYPRDLLILFLGTNPANFLEARHERMVAMQPQGQDLANMLHLTPAILLPISFAGHPGGSTIHRQALETMRLYRHSDCLRFAQG